MGGTEYLVRYAFAEDAREVRGWPASRMESIVRASPAQRISFMRLLWKPYAGFQEGFDSDEGFDAADWDWDAPYLDLVWDEKLHDLGRALVTWKPSPSVGLCISCDNLPPGGNGFPEIYGACDWWFYWFADAWQVEAHVHYPSSAVHRDPRWVGWREQFIIDSMNALQARAARGTTHGKRAALSSDAVAAELDAGALDADVTCAIRRERRIVVRSGG